MRLIWGNTGAQNERTGRHATFTPFFARRMAAWIAFTSRRSLLCRFSVREHCSEIMLGVLDNNFGPNHIAGLGLSLG